MLFSLLDNILIKLLDNILDKITENMESCLDMLVHVFQLSSSNNNSQLLLLYMQFSWQNIQNTISCNYFLLLCLSEQGTIFSGTVL